MTQRVTNKRNVKLKGRRVITSTATKKQTKVKNETKNIDKTKRRVKTKKKHKAFFQESDE